MNNNGYLVDINDVWNCLVEVFDYYLEDCFCINESDLSSELMYVMITRLESEIAKLMYEYSDDIRKEIGSYESERK